VPVRKIEVILKPFELEAAKRTLRSAGIRSYTLSVVHGFGPRQGQSEFYRGNEYVAHSLPMLKLELVVSQELTRTVVRELGDSLRNDGVGEGSIFVLPLEDAVHIRSNERLRAAGLTAGSSSQGV
jgi:nitrogen regulatory protein P-II 1